MVAPQDTANYSWILSTYKLNSSLPSLSKYFFCDYSLMLVWWRRCLVVGDLRAVHNAMVMKRLLLAAIVDPRPRRIIVSNQEFIHS